MKVNLIEEEKEECKIYDRKRVEETDGEQKEDYITGKHNQANIQRHPPYWGPLR